MLHGFGDRYTCPNFVIQEVELVLYGLFNPRLRQLFIGVFISIGGAKGLVQRYDTTGAIFHAQRCGPGPVLAGKFLGLDLSNEVGVNIIEVGVDIMVDGGDMHGFGEGRVKI